MKPKTTPYIIPDDVALITIGKGNKAAMSLGRLALSRAKRGATAPSTNAAVASVLQQAKIRLSTDEDVIEFPSSSVPSVASYLRSQGLRVELNNKRVSRSLFDKSLLRNVLPDHRKLLEAVQQHQHGQLVVVDDVEAQDVYWLFCRVLSSARILLVLPDFNSAFLVATRLEALSGQTADLRLAGTHTEAQRWTITDAKNMPWYGKWDILMFPAGEDGVGDEVYDRLAAPHLVIDRQYTLVRYRSARNPIAVSQLSELVGLAS